LSPLEYLRKEAESWKILAERCNKDRDALRIQVNESSDREARLAMRVCDLWAQVEEDRAAIRALMEQIRRLQSGMAPNSQEPTDAWMAHAAAIARAEGKK
jgi:hypothetical protein